jgi:hypothetical protein
VGQRLGFVCGLAVAATVVGAFGPWRNSGSVSLDGFQGPHDGWLAILFAVIALAGIRSLARAGWPGIVLVLVCGAAVVYFPVRNLVDDNGTFGGGSGWGLWLTIAAGGVLVAASVLAASGRLRRERASPTEPVVPL